MRSWTREVPGVVAEAPGLPKCTRKPTAWGMSQLYVSVLKEPASLAHGDVVVRAVTAGLHMLSGSSHLPQ